MAAGGKEICSSSSPLGSASTCTCRVGANTAHGTLGSESMGTPSTSLTTSCGRKPSFSAGPLGRTAERITPQPLDRPNPAFMVGVIVCAFAPIGFMRTRPFCFSSQQTKLDRRSGHGKAQALAPAGAETTKVLMPKSFPSRYTGAPPRLPRLIGASAWTTAYL